MTITTKFQPRQKVWTMIGSDCLAKPVEVEILKTKIIINPDDDRPIIRYFFQKSTVDEPIEMGEFAFYETKEQLIAALYK